MFVSSAATAAAPPAAADGPVARVETTGAPASIAAIPARGGRPRIALVLAGGGARGGAHAGVLKVLEEMRVPVDCIAGTSMGALVGGGYASGLPADDLDALLRGIDWKAVIGGVGARTLEPAEQKRLNDATGSFELGIRDGRIVQRQGLFSTTRIEDVLRSFVARARGVGEFDQLPIPYRAIATDMLTGRMVVLDRGDIATAMRASMAIPAIFAPVDTSEHLLSDGGTVRNLPIDVGRELCGDVVIAVNLPKREVTREQLGSAVSMLMRHMEVMAMAGEQVQLATLTPRDVRIDVELGDLAAQDFGRIPEAIAAGEAAARAAAERLAPLSLPPDEYREWRAAVTVRQDLEVRVAAVEFEPSGHVSGEFLRSITRVRAGDSADATRLAADAARLSALDEIDSISYELRGDPANPIVVWQPVEAATGRDVLRPSLGIYGSRSGDVQVELAVRHVRRWVNELGGQWRNLVQVGSTTQLETGFYQPLDVAQRWFVEPTLLARVASEDFYLDGERIARFRFEDRGGRVDTGVNLGLATQLRLGWWNVRRRVSNDIGAPLLASESGRETGLSFGATRDTRTETGFATRGSATQLQYLSSEESFGAERDWQRVEAATRHVFPLDRSVVRLTLAGGSDLGSEVPYDRAFSLGGPQSFPGFAPGELRVRAYGTVAADYLRRVADLVEIVDQALYVGVGVQATRVHERFDRNSDETLYGGSLFVGGRTPFGTVTIGVGAGGAGVWNTWITLGKPVGSGSILSEPVFR
jgi:NTE family protein